MVIVFLYLFVLSQVVYLANAKNLEVLLLPFFFFQKLIHIFSQEFAEGLFFALTEMVTIPMHYFLKKRIISMRKSLEKLESASFLPKDEVEEKFMSWAMIRTIGFHRPSIGLCFICIIVWSVFLFSPNSTMISIVPASFPFNFESGFGCFFIWVYQVIGTSYSAFLYSTYDTLVTGVYFHLTAQLNRLGYHLSKVWYSLLMSLNLNLENIPRLDTQKKMSFMRANVKKINCQVFLWCIRKWRFLHRRHLNLTNKTGFETN